MRRLIPIITLFALATSAIAQDQGGVIQDVSTTNGKVTITSKGADVRNVLFDLFKQSKTNFVLEPNIYFILYLSLAGVEFGEALDIVCNLAGLEYKVDNGIHFIGKKKSGFGAPANAEVKPQAKPLEQPAKRGKLTESELNKRLTTRFTKTVITDVFKSMTEQTGIEIILDADVPLYRIDAYLIDTSLGYAMDVIVRSTQLKYTLTDDKQIRVSKK
jgi:hypothetical protein